MNYASLIFYTVSPQHVEGPRAVVGLYLFNSISRKSRYLLMMRLRGHNSNSGSVELSIGSVIGYHWEQAATEIGERQACPKIVASAFQKHMAVFVQSLFFVLPISNSDYWHILCMRHRVQC